MPHHKVQKITLTKAQKHHTQTCFKNIMFLRNFDRPYAFLVVGNYGSPHMRMDIWNCCTAFFLLETQWSQCVKKTWKNTCVSDPWISLNHCRKVAVVKLLEQIAGTAGKKWKQRVLCQTLSLHSMSQTMIKQKTEQECFNFNRHIQKKGHKMSQATKYVKSTFEA